METITVIKNLFTDEVMIEFELMINIIKYKTIIWWIEVSTNIVAGIC